MARMGKGSDNGFREAGGAAGAPCALTAGDALRLCALTDAFYRAQAASFAETRQAAWPGWARCLEAAGLDAHRAGAGAPDAGGEPLRVLDLGCGNLRFERFLEEALPGAPMAFHAIDCCDGLAALGADTSALRSPVRYQSLDAMAALAAGEGLQARPAAHAPGGPAASAAAAALARAIEAPDRSCGLAVAFGFMHHAPLAAWRCAVLAALCAKVRPGGHVAVSFWQFMGDARLAAKAREATAAARAHVALPPLGPGDWLLGWQGKPDVWRFCHHASDEEIDALLERIAPLAEPVARFKADGRSGALNAYAVLRVR